MTEKRENLTPEEKAKLEEKYKKAMNEVDKKDVEYVLAKTMGKADELLDSAVEWIKKLAKQVTLLYQLLRDWWNGEYETPWSTIAAITAALLYFINPFDLIPDFLPVIGYIDDATVIGIALRLIQDDIRKYAQKKGIDLKEYGLE